MIWEMPPINQEHADCGRQKRRNKTIFDTICSDISIALGAHGRTQLSCAPRFTGFSFQIGGEIHLFWWKTKQKQGFCCLFMPHFMVYTDNLQTITNSTKTPLKKTEDCAIVRRKLEVPQNTSIGIRRTWRVQIRQGTLNVLGCPRLTIAYFSRIFLLFSTSAVAGEFLHTSAHAVPRFVLIQSDVRVGWQICEEKSKFNEINRANRRRKGYFPQMSAEDEPCFDNSTPAKYVKFSPDYRLPDGMHYTCACILLYCRLSWLTSCKASCPWSNRACSLAAGGFPPGSTHRAPPPETAMNTNKCHYPARRPRVYVSVLCAMHHNTIAMEHSV